MVYLMMLSVAQTVVNGRMINERGTGNNVEGGGLFQDTIPQQLPARTQENNIQPYSGQSVSW
jgi:hypothetical protein